MRTRYVDQGINSTVTRVQYTRRVTRVQHTKSDSRAVSLLACSTQISLMCSARNIACMQPIACHTSLTCGSLDKNWRTHMCSVHVNVNLEMSCTVWYTYSYTCIHHYTAIYKNCIWLIVVYVPCPGGPGGPGGPEDPEGPGGPEDPEGPGGPIKDQSFKIMFHFT